MSYNDETTSETRQENTNNIKVAADDEEDYGFSLFPERDGERKKKGFFSALKMSGIDKLNCDRNVNACMEKSHFVKLLVNALASNGCPINLERHISCEPCIGRVSGGYDVTKNQVVVCQNNSSKMSVCCGVLAHELIHVFDYCRAKIDLLNNMEHLACSEIRAAALIHCSYLSSLQGGSAPYNIKKRHEECVKQKAVFSVIAARNVEIAEAKKIVNKVFDKCYNDLEPFGRIPRRKSRDAERMYYEGCQFGYTPDGIFNKK